MKRIFLFSVASVLAFVLTSCTNSEESKCFIHYTPDTLDVKTAKMKAFIQNSNLIPKSDEDLDSMFNALAQIPYENYSGTVPEFSQGFNTDTIVDENGWRTIVLTRKCAKPEYNIIYIHGGAFFMSFGDNHRQLCEALLDRLNAAIYIPLYPLTPNGHRVNDGMAMLLNLYKKLLAEGKRIYIMGDSAGGNLTLSLTLQLKDLGLQLPEALFPISPVVDFTYENPEIAEVAKVDPMLTLGSLNIGRKWAEDGMSLNDPLVSPLYGDLKGMPRTFFFVGSDDVSAPDAVLMYDKMKEAGVEVGMLYGKSLWHIAPTCPIPAQQQYIQEVARFIGD